MGGGEDFDQRVMEHFIKVFNKKSGKDMSKDKRSLQKLRKEVEKTKRALSSTHQARLEIEALFDGEDFSESLTRARFEELCGDLFKKTLGQFDMSGIPPAPRGQPQIEVTFEIDSNGILNVGAEDKGTGASEKITITNDKGRLTEEEIEKMIREAEEFAEEDKLAKERIDARNAFDGYIHSMKSAVEGSGDNKGLGEKMDEDEKETIEDAIKDGQDWLSSNPEADAEEIKEKQKEIEGICSPIIQKYYQGGGGGASDDDDDDDDEAHDEL